MSSPFTSCLFTFITTHLWLDTKFGATTPRSKVWELVTQCTINVLYFFPPPKSFAKPSDPYTIVRDY